MGYEMRSACCCMRMSFLGRRSTPFTVSFRRSSLQYVLEVIFSILLALLPSVAQAAGIRDIVIPADANHPRIVAELWTPCATPSQAIMIDRGGFPTAIRGVRNCAITQKNLPLIVISHGMLEDRFSHHDTAEALADAGFAVVAFNHTQDSSDDLGAKSVADISSFLVRPLDIKRVINFFLESPPTGLKIDASRIGFFGFSRGGYTGLVLAGAEPDFDTLIIPCPEEYAMCQQIKEHRIPPHAPGYEPRIKAYVIADPVDLFASESSLQKVRAPIQLWSSEFGGMGVRPEDVAAVRKNLPIKTEFHRATGAGHLSFDCPCSEDQLKAPSPSIVCTDPPGFDRIAFHRKFNAMVVDFFRRKLPK